MKLDHLSDASNSELASDRASSAPLIVPEHFTRSVRLPLRLSGETWRLLDGGPIPSLREGTIGDLIVDADAFLKADELDEWTRERDVAVLAAGETLWVRLNKDRVDGPLAQHKVERQSPPAECFHAVCFQLKQDLGLKLRGAKKAVLNDCLCFIPSLNQQLKSVNETATRISTVFEPSRRSHSVNVFKNVYYERRGILYPLEKLRQCADLASVTKEDLDRLMHTDGELPAS